MCARVARRRCQWRSWVVEEKNTGVWVDGKEEVAGEQPRKRISGKIIAKFEYDSPRGYDPVEDIREILQASFV